MARPLRVDFPGSLHHVTARGVEGRAIYLDDDDRLSFLRVVADACKRHAMTCLAYCLMTNHYHLAVRSDDGRLSAAIHRINSIHAQRFNRRHARRGHLFQARFDDRLVQADRHVREVLRYVVLNPVRARMVGSPEAWPWSSYRATSGEAAVPSWLDPAEVLSMLGADGTSPERYRRFVLEGIGGPGPWGDLRGQIYLGDEEFARESRARTAVRGNPLEVPRVQREPVRVSLAEFLRGFGDPVAAMAAATATGRYTLREIAAWFGVHPSTVSRAGRVTKRTPRDAAIVSEG